MIGRTVVAQATGQQQPGGTATQTIHVNKPLDQQAVTIHLNGETNLDLSAIANESITLVHLGDRLVIVFDNHAQVTLEPFYGDNGQPLANLSVELGPGRDVSSSEFAGLFPITTDESVLPASGGPNSPSSGANFNPYSVDPLLLPTPLPLLGPEAFHTEFGTILGVLLPLGFVAPLSTNGGGDTITTHNVSILEDQTNFPLINHSGPESTSNNFSIPVLSLLQGDSSTLAGGPLDLTVTGVSSSVPGVSLTSDHQYVLFPFLADGTSGTFTVTVSDGTTTALETVTVNQVQLLPMNFGIDLGGVNGNDFLIENIQAFAGFNTLANVTGDNQLIGNRVATILDGYDSLPADGKTPLDSGGDDLLVGRTGSILTAGAGNDTLWGEGGGSTLNGGQVANKTTTFYFQGPNDAGSTVNNFDSQPGQNDVIALSADGFDAAAGSTVFTRGQAVTVGTTSGGVPVWTPGDHLMYDTTNHGLYYSDNGTGAGAHLVLLATVTNHTVTAGDIHIAA
jgi:hypothetical protein